MTDGNLDDNCDESGSMDDQKDDLLDDINEDDLEQDDACNDDKATSEKLPPAEYYDADIDKQNEEWMANKRNEFMPKEDKDTKSKSDAILNCPACMSTVCVDCQRHDLYKNQYRAMFVLNCNIVENQLLRY